MEHSLIKSLLNNKFYDDTKHKCNNKLFSKDLRKIKAVIDNAMDSYKRDLSLDEVKSLFFVSHPTLTTAQKHQFDIHFSTIHRSESIGTDVANDVFSKLFQQLIGEEVANLGFQYVNGEINSMQPLREIVNNYQDNFTPSVNVDVINNDVDYLLDNMSTNTKWKFNIMSLKKSAEGVDDGMLFVVGARSNVGKSSFHATLCAAPNGWASQGANILILCNEEKPERIAARYMTAATGMTLQQIKENKEEALEIFNKIRSNIKFVDATGRTMAWAESVIKKVKPNIVIMDIGSKFSDEGASTNNHEALKANAIHARNIGKLHNCLVVYCTQLSAEAENKVVITQAMIEGSRTGLAGESDLMILIARNPPMTDQTEDDGIRYLNVVKNKVTGDHKMITCEFDFKTGENTS